MLVMWALSTGCAMDEDPPVDNSVVIAVQDNPGGTLCTGAVPRWYVFSPATASVPVDGGFTWRNDATTSVTIETYDGTPLMTLAPGETGSDLVYKTAGVYVHGVMSCYNHSTSNAMPETSGRSNITVTVAFD